MTDAQDPNRGCAETALAMLERLERDALAEESVDEAFRLLADRRRRLLIDVVRTHGEELALPDAAEEVAERESGRSVVELSPEYVKEVYVSLYHDHLPRLVEVGLLEYEQQRDLVAPDYR